MFDMEEVGVSLSACSLPLGAIHSTNHPPPGDQNRGRKAPRFENVAIG